MSQPPAEDEAELQTLLKQLLRSIHDRISGAPSAESAEEILLHLEETDKSFHNYEFVKFLRQHVESSLGSVVEEETRSFTRGEAQHAIGSGHDSLIHAVTRRTRDSAEYQQMMQTLKNRMTAVVESLINKFEEDQLRKEKQHGQSNADNCSDSDSSFNQSYAFIRQEQLQVLVEKLDVSKPKQVRWEALQALCCAPPSDVLSCESWSGLRRKLCAALSEADPDLSDLVLQFFSRSFSSSPLNVTREIYTSLGHSVEASLSSQKLIFPSGSSVLDVNAAEISRLLKQIRLINDFQKEVTTFWIRHPEKYMEEVIEATFSMLTPHQDHGSAGPEKPLEAVHLLALLDVKATWFKKWMHGYYSRTVVLRLLERPYKSLVVAAVQQCVRYSEARGHVPEDAAGLLGDEQQTHGSLQRSVYSGRELEYAYFVHSLCILGKILSYANGRKLFPVKLRKHKDPVSLTDLVVILINIMYRDPKSLPGDASHSGCLSPTSLVMELLWTLCERDECAAECLLQDSVMETLLEPLMGLLQGQQVKLASPAATLTLIADVLARIANTDGGLSLFLYRENLLLDKTRTSAAHVIVRFSLKLLAKDLLPSPGGAEALHWTLCGAFIFVCRQIYNTCEGLQALLPYGVHSAVASAWKQTISQSERVPTPVPGASSQETLNMLVWEETLLDSLLNFAATPKGLLLLQQTGAISECVSYMFSRFTRKLQVSRCEKFGYGVMVTQIAATAPGVRALHASGLVRALVVELWFALEGGGDDVRVVRPKPTPMEPIDRRCLKSFLSLVNVLSSSRSLWELLGRQPLANKGEYPLREVPTSIPDLIDRLIAVNSDVKIRSLFHYEQSHTFGLRLLSVLCCNLDSFLLLESQYDISSMLLQSQRDNVVDPENNQGEVIVDSLSVERNHVLVRIGVVGGPSERTLPPRALQEGERPYPWPMFSSYPLPDCYTLDRPEIRLGSQDSEIGAFLTSPKDPTGDQSWMDVCRKQFCKAVTSEPNALTGGVLADLLEGAVAHLSSSASECFFSPPRYKAEEKSVKNATLSAVEQLGIHTCLRYGRNLKLLTDEAAHQLMELTKHVKTFLSSQRVKASSQLVTLQDGYPGHDWLLSTVFLLMAGDMERSLSFLLRLSALLTSAFIWPARIHASVRLPREVAESGVPPVYWCTAHYVEMLLKAEVPLVHSAFRMSGFTPSQMCLHWLTQCFWNYLDWAEICLYLSTCVVMGPDYQVYVCVALLKHLQPDILQRTQAQELQVFLKEEPIQDFRLGDHLEFMMGLERRYRTVVLTDMRTILDPVQ